MYFRCAAAVVPLPPFAPRRSSDLCLRAPILLLLVSPSSSRHLSIPAADKESSRPSGSFLSFTTWKWGRLPRSTRPSHRSEEHTSELTNIVCRLLLEKKKRR